MDTLDKCAVGFGPRRTFLISFSTSRKASMLTRKYLEATVAASLLCLCPGCSEVNTTIAWPWTYWQYGFWPVIGGLVVGFLVYYAGAAFVVLASDLNTRGDMITGLLVGSVIWLVAGLLLQLLPHTTAGIQFIPLPPWAYEGWIPLILSVACWLCLAAGYLFVLFSQSKDAPSFSLFAALCINTFLLSFWNPVGPDTTLPIASRSTLVKSYQSQIDQMEAVHRERSKALEKLSTDRGLLIARIQGIGVRTKAELMAHPVGRTLAEELGHLTNQIARLKSEASVIDSALERAKSTLRTIDREEMLKGVGVAGEKKFEELARIDRELQEELRRVNDASSPEREIHLDKLLDDVLCARRTLR